MLDIGGALGDASWLDALTSIVGDLAAPESHSSLAAEGRPCGSCEAGSGDLDPAVLVLALIGSVVLIVAAAVATRTLARRPGGLLTTR